MRGFVIVAMLVLAGCDGRPATKGDMKKEVEYRATADVRLEQRISDLSDEVSSLQQELDDAKKRMDLMAGAVGDVSNRVSENARIANENAARDMTRNGACGRETVYYQGGGWSVRNKECTTKDLK